MGRRPRSLLVSASSFWLLWIHRAGLFRDLQAAGYAIIAVAPEGRGMDELRSIGVETQILPIDPIGTSPLADLALLGHFVRLFRRLRPAAFLGFTVKPNVYGSFAAHLCGVPTISNISGLGRVFTSRTLLTRFVERMYRWGLQWSCVVFFENRDDAHLFLSQNIVRKEQVVPLPGAGLDLARFAPMRREAGPEARVTFLLAGRLLWSKGVQQFVDAARIVRRERPDTRFQILGFTEPQGRESVPLEALEQWNREGIEYLGGSSDVRSFIATADCVVLPSFYREGVPRILMEAAAMARPVITTDMPGCREAVDDQLTGLLCAPRSVDSLVEALRQFLGLSAGERDAMARKARAKMEREFDQAVVHRAYRDALTQCLGDNG